MISLNITKKEIQEAVNAGFEKVKLKIGKNIEGEAAWLRNMSELFPKLRWRLDANASLNFEEFGSFWREISFLHGRIDFVEDPCPFDFEKWKSLSKQVPLALDIEFSHWEECFKKGKVLPLKGLVLKPEAQDAQSLAHLYQEHFEFLTVTSYMSHPMGQVWSGFCSEKLFEKYPNKWVEGGVSSHHVFEENEFSQFLPPTNSLFLFGKKELESFENLLEKCDWQVLG